MSITPFIVDIPESDLDDLRTRLANTRWPDEVEGPGWDYGVPRRYLEDLVAYWQDGFDWREQERAINRFPQYRVAVEDHRLHVVHVHGRGPDRVPVLLLHGWPSSFVELLPIVPLLTDPAAHGADPAVTFDVVLPSLPGYAFSEQPLRRGLSYADDADALAGLMERLGYDRYVIHAHDHGAVIAAALMLRHPEQVIGYHTTEPALPRPPLDPTAPDLSQDERAYLQVVECWRRHDSGYALIQSTRPQTLAYALNDSPAGLAAWIIDKWHAWTAPPSGDLGQHVGADLLLTTVSLYWLTQSINATMRAYYEGVQASDVPGPDAVIDTPMGVALVARPANERPPREYAARRFSDIRRWVELPRGGHFTVAEEPALVADAIRTFVRELRR